MQVGVHYANFGHPDWETRLVERLTETVRIADQGGATLVTAMDHWFQMEEMGGPSAPMLEGYTTLGYLAGITERVRLGLLVTGTTYRRPGLLAKTVTTLDRLSGGRAVLGLGAAWYEREHRALGVPFPPMAERFERLEETLQICLQMWSDDDGPYAGQHYLLDETICVPAPLARPHPPIMIGGAGEKKTLRMVAQYAQSCNIYAESVERMTHKLAVLRGHCDTLDTDYEAIEKTMILDRDPLDDTEAFLRLMGEYAALGVSLVTLMPRSDDPVAWTSEVCTTVLPRMAEL